MWVEIRDGSDNFLIGLSSVERAQEFMAWLGRQDDEIRRDRRVIAFDADGTPHCVFPNDHKEH